MSETLDTDTTQPTPEQPRARRSARNARAASSWWRTVASRPAALAAAAVAAVLVLGIAVDAAASAGRIHPGVRVDGVSVGGMTVEEAAGAIASGATDVLGREVVLEAGDEQWKITAQEVGGSVDATALAQAAYRIGRSGNVARSVKERLFAWFGAERVALRVRVDDAALDGLLDAIDASVGSPAADASVEVVGIEARLVPAKDGLGVDRVAARDAIARALASDERVVRLDLVPVKAAVQDEGAQDALAAAKRALSAPLVVRYETSTWSVEPASIAKWLAFRRAESTASADSVLECYLASDEVSRTLTPIVGSVGKPAKDASFKVSKGAVTIVPSQDGLALDAEAFSKTALAALTGDGERVVDLPMRRVEPEITTEDAKQMGIKERIATYTTDYSPSNKPRVNNIHLLADALDGTLVPPGGVFSFNETIGPRTAEKGYQEANAIVNGKLVPQLGGGVCQVGTTIFNTVFFSGLPVVERHNHSLYISHYPKGRDATVSWGGPDFKFRNDTEHWILIATSYTSSTVTISLYGTDPGYEVSYTTSDFFDLKDYPVREVKDPTLPVGTRVIEEKGVKGRSVIVTRIVKKDGAVIRKDTFKSVYRPAEEVVRVGTKVVSSTPSTSTTTGP
ncbi:MAG: VanW family protein [Anaerosomatales bacterium]|nr:VanW family protein [Anaerosomatales bacterium]